MELSAGGGSSVLAIHGLRESFTCCEIGKRLEGE
jgi:hypothetical protein